MASGDYGKPQTEYERQNTGGGGGNKAQNVATQDNDLSQQILGVANRLQRKYGSRQWFGSAVDQIEPIFDKLDQAGGESVCLEQHGSTVSIMKARQTSQGSQSR